MVRCESCSSKIGHITLDTKQTGAPSAGNPHAGCDVAGAGNGFTVWLLRHSQRKRGAMARSDLRDTAPVLDPTPSVQEDGIFRAARLELGPTRCSCRVPHVSTLRPGIPARLLSAVHTRSPCHFHAV